MSKGLMKRSDFTAFMITGSPFTEEQLLETVKDIYNAGALRFIPEGKQRNPIRIVVNICMDLKYSETKEWTWRKLITELSLYGASYPTYKKYFDAYEDYGLVRLVKGNGVRWIANDKEEQE